MARMKVKGGTALAVPPNDRKIKLHLAETLRQPPLRAALRTIRQTPEIYESIKGMIDRKDELMRGRESLFPTPFLAGIAANPRARAIFDHAIDRHIARESLFIADEISSNRVIPEVIIGAGVHASIFAAARMAETGETPFVIEQDTRIGGVFATALRPVFEFNSRNRVEREDAPRLPGTAGPLNSEIKGVLQPSDISFQEYPTQTEQAFVTRVNLALYARVLAGWRVTRIEKINDQYKVYLFNTAKRNLKRALITKRVIVASGLGSSKGDLLRAGKGFDIRSSNYMPFAQFVRRMGDTSNKFPLQGMKRVAVIGAKDSGRTAVEYLLGQGPTPGMSVVGLDFVEQIFWVGQKSMTKEEFEACERSRYKGIARAFPRKDNPEYYYRITPMPGRATSVTPERDKLRVRVNIDGRIISELVDVVIDATGFEDNINDLFKLRSIETEVREKGTGPIIARKFVGEEIYKIGPIAKIPVSDDERERVKALVRIPDNSVAIFRYAERTATLAKIMPKIEGQYPWLGLRPPRSYLESQVPKVDNTVSVEKSQLALPEGLIESDMLKSLISEAFMGSSFYRKGISVNFTRRENIYSLETSVSGSIAKQIIRKLLYESEFQMLLDKHMTWNRTDKVRLDIPARNGKPNLGGIRLYSL